MRHLILSLALLLLITCRPAHFEKGITYHEDEAKPIKLGDTWVTAVEKTESFSFATQKTGEARVTVGNPHSFPISVSVENQNLTIKPQSWATTTAVAGSEGFTVNFDKGPILWGPVYQKPLLRDPQLANIMLISIDTLRHDAFSPQLMPNLYRIFSENGLIFERAYTPSPWTLPAHASMLTGLLPAKHGIRTSNQKLDPNIITLAEFLELSGYYNVAITEGNYVSGQFGFTQGFHLFSENPPNMMLKDPAALSKLEPNLKQLEQQLDELNNQSPIFAFLHSYEVHCPYLPHFGLLDPEQIGMTQWLLDNETKGISPAHMKQLHNLYNGEVRYTDRTLAPFVEKLINSGEWTVILTADHGEEFGEHGGILHADTLYEEVMRVPLALAGKGIKQTDIIDTRVSLLDIVPTILHMTEPTMEAVPDSMPGRNLLDPGLKDAVFFAETYFLGPHIQAQDPRLAAIWNQDDKLIQSRNNNQYHAELYNLVNDPQERANLSESEIEKRDALYLFLDAYLEKGETAPAVGELSAEQLEVMRTLGYVK